MPDHIHILVGIRPHQAISAIVQNVKTESSRWIKDEGYCSGFAWQEGYGAFSYSRSQLPDVINYISNQEEHHRKRTFLEEYQKILTAFEVEWDEAYIFNDPE